jgi:hypothetical protein
MTRPEPMDDLARLSTAVGRPVRAVVAIDFKYGRLAGLQFPAGQIVMLGTLRALARAEVFNAAMVAAGRPPELAPLGHRSRKAVRTILRQRIAAQRSQHHPPKEPTHDR